VAKAWQDPNVLARTLRQLDTDPTFGGAATGKIKQAIALTVPAETFANATKIAAADVAALAQQSQQNTQVFGNLFTSTERLPSSLFRFGTSLDFLSLRLQGININPPIFGGQPSPPKSDFNFGGQPQPSKPSFNFGASYRPPSGDLNSLKASAGGSLATTRGRAAGAAAVPANVSINVHVPAGSPAAESPEALAHAIAAEFRAELADINARLSSPAYVEEMVAHRLEIDTERA